MSAKLTLILLTLITLLPIPAAAVEEQPVKIAQIGLGLTEVLGPNGLASPITNENAALGYIRLLILRVIGGVLALLAVISMGALVYGGYTYITSLGNEDRARHGKNIITYTIAGLVVIGLAAVLVNALINISTA